MTGRRPVRAEPTIGRRALSIGGGAASRPCRIRIDGVARQLSGLGLFRYDGQAGNLRAPWMGNWNYLRAHPLFAGIPADMVAPLQHRFLESAVRWLATAG